MNYEYRAEIIANQSVQDDITELLEEEIQDIQYTLIPETHGKGGHTKKLGDTVWPEMNFVLITYVNKDDAVKIRSLVEKVKARFPKEGISLFFSKCEEI